MDTKAPMKDQILGGHRFVESLGFVIGAFPEPFILMQVRDTDRVSLGHGHSCPFDGQGIAQLQ